jgi:hypothetical protein
MTLEIRSIKVGGFLLCLEEALDGSSSGKERDMM